MKEKVDDAFKMKNSVHTHLHHWHGPKGLTDTNKYYWKTKKIEIGRGGITGRAHHTDRKLVLRLLPPPAQG
jgi:hypothetical protein